MDNITALRTSSVDALLPFPRPQQAHSEGDPSSKPCSPPDSPAHLTIPFHRSAKTGKGRCFGVSEAEPSPSASSDVEEDTGAQYRQLRGKCASSCILLLPGTSVTSSQPLGPLPYTAARMQACLQLLEHAASANAELSKPAEPATDNTSSPQPQSDSACRSDSQPVGASAALETAIVPAQHKGGVLCCDASSKEEEERTASPWAEVPDDILRSVCGHMPPSYVRVVRLVCRGWAAAAGRLMQRLKPEALEGPRLAQRFPHLCALDLSHCLHTVTFHTQTALQLRSNVTDELVGQLAPLTNLRELSLRGCTGLTGAPDSGFARIAAFARLECLDISNCKLLQDDALKVVGQLPGLRQLRAVGCTALTDAALHKLAALQDLVQLDLGCNALITDAGIAALANMQGLEQVNLVSLAQVTNAGVAALDALPNLKRITVSRCARICESGMQEHFAGKHLRVSMCGTPLRRSMCAWMSSVLADLDNLLFER
ncbi:RNI-like protein [Coccomyxa subellipsoidea C-169]|uniref:RNI-like protein n=1 Tax=Coccomyxa subellipsoidea (strain C-169) TaxID=574566 RepID=I0YXG9_COCSC|nr:RNI-like protein [Coccomyxa subellipsoidea C-169]EIE23088.1 RNI-like protein [Coccomyxa subellipsoidea C-169]|eukprot:XP_005647632.1 RNI-like protein [Coccomyxa subellipsoidea C-169]